MLSVDSSVVINKPVADVFAYAANAANNAKWQNGLESVIVDGPTDKVGAKFTEVRKFMGQEMKSAMQITAFEPNKKWAVKVLEGPVLFEITVLFESAGTGTKMSTHIQGEPKGFFKVAEGMLKGNLQKTLDEDGQRLKKLLEGG